MKINYDKIADAIYFLIKKGKIQKSIKINDRLLVDISKSGAVLGIEILDASSEQGSQLERNIKEGVPVNIVSSTPQKI